MILKGKVITLRAVEEEDLEMLRCIINDPEVERLLVGWAYPISKYQQKQWFINSSNSPEKRFIIDTENHGPIGLVVIGDIDWKNRTAVTGIKIGDKKYRGKGFGTDAIMTVMRYAFEELQLNKLETGILDYNTASLKLHCGRCVWKLEGIKRQCIYKEGSYHDLHILGILRNEYQELVKNTDYWKDTEI